MYDPRIVAARGDLADVRLADRVFAPHYAAAVARTALTRTPVTLVHDGAPVSELLVGERFDVLEMSHGLAWGVGGGDGVVGFVALAALGPFEERGQLVADGEHPAGSRVAGDGAPPFVTIADAADHLVGTPPAPGGRSGAGVDPAGFVQLAATLAGRRLPRFADLIAAAGDAVDGPPARGDILLFDAAAAIALDDTHVIAAAADRPVERRALADLGTPVAHRRLP